MSNRMCANCKNVVSNTCYSGDICPNCDSNEWASPLDHNDEWEIIRKLQTENIILEEIVRMYKDKATYNPNNRRSGYWAFDYLEKKEE